MPYSAIEAIQRRRSVRTYDPAPAPEKDIQALMDYIEALTDPFGGRVEFRLLDAKEKGLSSPVIVGEKLYFAAKAQRTENFEAAVGYRFEAACLYARYLGLGTVMLAGTLDRAAFERAMELKENEVMPVVSPLGVPAQKKSLRETLMRKGTHADERKPFSQLFFDGEWGRGLTREAAGVFGTALEMARLAPSAVNRQPWRAVAAGDTVHFFEEKTMKDSPQGDLQRVDMGIALCHFHLTMQEEGRGIRMFTGDPGISRPDNARYFLSCQAL